MPQIHSESSTYDELSKLSTIELFIQAQELVQDLVSKFVDTHSVIKQSISQNQPGQPKKYNLDEHLNAVSLLFAKVRLITRILNQRKSELDQQLATQPTNELHLQQLRQHRDNLVEQINEKNASIKLATDNLLAIIWQISAVQSLK